MPSQKKTIFFEKVYKRNRLSMKKNKRKNISDPVEKKLRYKSLGNVILLQVCLKHELAVIHRYVSELWNVELNKISIEMKTETTNFMLCITWYGNIFFIHVFVWKISFSYSSMNLCVLRSMYVGWELFNYNYITRFACIPIGKKEITAKHSAEKFHIIFFAVYMNRDRIH